MRPSSADLLARATAPQVDPQPMPSAMLVFAHPDDETIALGARMARFGNALLIHITDGAPTNGVDQLAHGFETLKAYREARIKELEAMLAAAGVPNMRHECFEIPDQESCLQLKDIALRVAQRMREFRPEVVFTHPYEGGHPDHDACAFAVHNGVALLQCRGEQPPIIIEAPFYHATLHGSEGGAFLRSSPPVPEVVYTLSPSEKQQKQRLIDCFTSQRETLSGFHREDERFRIAPKYEFRRTPHPGAVLYDDRPWGMTSEGFTKLAWEAEDALAEEMKAPCN